MQNINTIAELESLYDKPGQTSLSKVSPHVTPAYAKLIEASPLCLITSSGPEGLDCSPRGDKPGFVRMLDSQTLAIPDRRGNNRLDTLRNVVRSGKISLLFLIPGVSETLRVNGTAVLTTDAALVESFSVDEKQPTTVIVVSTKEVYFQCARALIRSDFWNIKNHVERKTLPSAGEMTKSALSEFDAETYDKALPSRQNKTLY